MCIAVTHAAERTSTFVADVQRDRVVITHDRNTMVGFALERVAAGDPMPGVFVVDNKAPFRQTIDDLLLIDDLTNQADWANRVEYLPL